MRAVWLQFPQHGSTVMGTGGGGALTGRTFRWRLYLNSHHRVCFPGKPNQGGAAPRTKARVPKVTEVALRVRPPGSLASSGGAPSPACDFGDDVITDDATVSL